MSIKQVRMISTHCHGCSIPMNFEAKPVNIVEWDGSTITYWGKAESPWICPTCRLEPKKLAAARVACGLPETPNVSSFEDEEELQEVVNG